MIGYNIIINSAVLSLVERSSSSQRFSIIYGKYREGNILGPEEVHVSLVCNFVVRTNIQCPFLGGFIIGGSTVYI